jgi:hypothetical protein
MSHRSRSHNVTRVVSLYIAQGQRTFIRYRPPRRMSQMVLTRRIARDRLAPQLSWR